MEKNAENVFNVFLNELDKLAAYGCASDKKEMRKKDENKKKPADMDKEAGKMPPAMLAQQEKMKAKMDDKDGDGKPEPDDEEISVKDRLAALKAKKGK